MSSHSTPILSPFPPYQKKSKTPAFFLFLLCFLLHACPSILVVRSGKNLPKIRYGFAIGNVAAFDMADPEAIVSPGGVGFDINCGVRLVRTNLTEAEVQPVKERLAQALFDHIPVGVGSTGIIPIKEKDLEVRVFLLYT